MRDKIQFQNILEKYFDEWEQIKENGMYDFLCTDGELLNTIRYSIINLKKGIENELDSKDYPEIYYRTTPPEVSDEYMAGSEEIRRAAAYNLNSHSDLL